MTNKLIACHLLLWFSITMNSAYAQSSGSADRQYWIKTLIKIADPVLNSLSKNELKKQMPVEVSNAGKNLKREEVTHLEAFGRLLAGLSPWLELGADATEEGQLRNKYIELSVKCIKVAVDTNSVDYLNFKGSNKQLLVDAAFFAHALIRAPKSLWYNLDENTKANVISALKEVRKFKAGENNWLLFSAMVETALLKFTGEWDYSKVEYAFKKHFEWYKGDGVYGDGADFHWDYYNSFVIQPMMIDILKICKEQNIDLGREYDKCLVRGQRYAAIQERLISPEGTFPAIGRSLGYRVGVFQLLGQISLMQKLRQEIKPAQVRCALTAVIKRTMEASGTFDDKGWLQIGFCGHQKDIAEGYISTGSLYLCSVGFLPLGLPANDEFWSAPEAPWTGKKIWSGENMFPDHSIKEK